MQRTIAKTATFNGKGMHSGRNAIVCMKPAKANTGFVFNRLDSNAENKTVPALWNKVIRYPACTCIANDQRVEIRTVEHLLAACYATGIDNLEIDIKGEEVPILDGSAEPTVQLIEEVGVTELLEPRKTIEICKPVYYEDEHRKFAFEPHDHFAVDINIYPGEYGHMQWDMEMTPEIFRREIVTARAWGRLKDVWIPKVVGNFLKRRILRGAGFNTAIVYAFGKPLNPAGLKHSDDMVRHKVLDIIGDLQLVGADIKGKITCHSSAHATNHAGMATLFEDDSAWRYI